MNILTVSDTGVIIYATSNEINTVDGGYFVDDTIFSNINNLDLFIDVDIDEIHLLNLSKYKYVNSQIMLNENYVSPPKTQEDLEQEIETLKYMIAELGLIVGGGL